MLQSLRSRFTPAPALPPALLGAPLKQGVVLLEDIICGAHYAVLNTAVVGSGFNALRNRRRFARPLSLRNHLPHPPSARLSWGRLMQEMRQPEGLSAPVSAYFSHLAVVEKQVEFICGEIESLGHSAAVQQHSGRMAQASRQMTELAMTAIAAIDKVAVGVISPCYTRNMIMLRSLLSDIQLGGTPLLDRDGSIFVPELPLPRASPRKRVHLRCVVEYRGKAAPAIVTNISATDAGLENAPPLTPRSVAVIEIGDRCFAGMVVWEHATSAAIKFDQPLKESDLLIAD